MLSLEPIRLLEMLNASALLPSLRSVAVLLLAPLMLALLVGCSTMPSPQPTDSLPQAPASLRQIPPPLPSLPPATSAPGSDGASKSPNSTPQLGSK